MMDEIAMLEELLSELRNKLNLFDDVLLRDASFALAEDKIKVALGMCWTGKTYSFYQTYIPLSVVKYLKIDNPFEKCNYRADYNDNLEIVLLERPL